MDIKLSDREFFIIRTAWRRLQAKEYDSREGWKRFNRQNIKLKRKRLFGYSSVAAIALLFLTVGYWQWQKTEETASFTSTQQIVRASGLPVLTLSNGEQVLLDKQNPDRMISQTGSSVLFDDSISSMQYICDSIPSKNTLLAYNTLYIPKGGEYVVVLADGTKVWLNSETTLRYPVNFKGEKREVELDGEAYFEVTSDASHPFCVRMGGQTVEVLGTHFNVSHYKTDSIWHTTLVEGKVKIHSSNRSYLLKPGTQYKEISGQGYGEVVAVDVLKYTSWREGKVYFQDECLEDIISRLARWYDFEVFYANPAIKKLHFGGAINKYNSFEVVLRYLERTANVHFDIRGKTVVAGLIENEK